MCASIRLCLLLLVVLTSACATTGSDDAKCPCASGARADADHGKTSDLSKQRLILSQGYSMLYTDASHVELMSLILYVKSQPEDFDKLITALSAYGGQLKKELERIAKEYPGVRIDLDPMPEMEKRKRMAIAKDKAIRFAPVVGIGGIEYERATLISMSNALNHESHLCRVMAEEEPDPNLKRFLLNSEKRYSELSERFNSLLAHKYFRTQIPKSASSK